MPSITVASDDPVRFFVEQQPLSGQGIGHIDAHWLTAVRLAPGTSLWTRDKHLLARVEQLSLAAQLTY